MKATVLYSTPKRVANGDMIGLQNNQKMHLPAKYAKGREKKKESFARELR